MITQETYTLLEDDNPLNRKKAIRQIGQSNEDSALALVRNVLVHDVDETVRRYASQVEGFMTHQREFALDDTAQSTYDERDNLEKRAIYDAKFNDPPPDIEDTDPAITGRLRAEMLKYSSIIFIGLMIFVNRASNAIDAYNENQFRRVIPNETTANLFTSTMIEQALIVAIMVLISLFMVMIQALLIHVVATQLFKGEAGLSYFMLGFMRINRMVSLYTFIYVLAMVSINRYVFGFMAILSPLMVIGVILYFAEHISMRLLLTSQFVSGALFVITSIMVYLAYEQFSAIALNLML